MTRFKELRRIEQALLHHDVEQLRWAEGYCQMRLGLARPGGSKQWRDLLRTVQDALGGADGASRGGSARHISGIASDGGGSAPRVSIEARRVCARFGVPVVAPAPADRLGIALDTLHLSPLNGLRHQPEAGTCGWYIWGGQELSTDPEFFQPLHVQHLATRCPAALPYLGLPPGYRFLLAAGQEYVWFDETLLLQQEPFRK